MNKKTLKDVSFAGKTVFCRVDFNVPMSDGVVTNDNRIVAALPTIKHLIGEGAKIVLASHLGRPKGEVKEELRLDPVANKLSELLGRQRSEEHTSELQSRFELVCRLLLEKKKENKAE